MPLGREVGLRPGRIVLDGDAAPPQKGYSPQFSAHVCCPNGWMAQDATLYGGRTWSTRYGVRRSTQLSPNSAQLQHTPYHFPSYIRVRAVVWEYSEGHTDKQTHSQRQTHRRPWPIYISPRLCLTRNVIHNTRLHTHNNKVFTLKHRYNLHSEWLTIQHNTICEVQSSRGN